MSALQTLRAGEIALLDTDTLPGLHALASLPQAAQKLRALKGSPSGRPFLLLFSSLDEVMRYARAPHGERLALLGRAWPGPLTALLSPNERALPEWVAKEGSIAVRVPDCAPLRALLAELGAPLFSTSANRAGQSPATTLQEASARFPRLAAFALGEPSRGVASTLVDLRGERVEILRAGDAPWPPSAPA